MQMRISVALSLNLYKAQTHAYIISERKLKKNVSLQIAFDFPRRKKSTNEIENDAKFSYSGRIEIEK